VTRGGRRGSKQERGERREERGERREERGRMREAPEASFGRIDPHEPGRHFFCVSGDHYYST
jgi:hypothetical protein